ncbi:protein ANTAGONIST OF LIKE HETEROCHROMATIN PROTEIN 1-like [Quercus lobata]|uniref:DDE Tnp4 domain-containing protein n=1 Tax=Quercus lobata TaxID=97700 RepID=A0A7N2N0M7_QUELO|nr:protein ANTAGONIST OF LIKE HETEROCHROMATIN PROTEIN 1-like [Quercus lobata]
MESRKLAALLSSLISELILLLLLLFPSSAPLSLNSNSSNSTNSNSNANLFPLIHHFLSIQKIAASLGFLSISRKRKRTHLPEPEAGPIDDEENPELGPRLGGGRVQLVLTRTPDSFKNCFRMTSSTFEWLSGLLEPLLECRDPVGSPLNLSAELRLGLGLYRLATGSDYPEISNRFGVSESVAKFCTKQLCRVLCTDFRFWVTFPTPNELESVSTAFQTLTGLPNCCGVLECTRFKVVKKNDEIEEHSIAAQIVVDSSCRILSIVAGYRGNKADYKVLKSSTLCKDIEEGRLLNSPPVNVNGVAVNQYLVGNRGYPLLPWLMVPYVEALPGSCEENFNKVHSLMRVSGLKASASLKNWGVLSRPVEEEFKIAVAYIGACSMLHNALLMREDYTALGDGLGDCYQSTDYYSGLEENLIGSKASDIRNALATRANELHD